MKKSNNKKQRMLFEVIYHVIIIILIGSVVGQIMFGNKADNDDQAAGKHVASRNSYNSRKA